MCCCLDAIRNELNDEISWLNQLVKLLERANNRLCDRVLSAEAELAEARRLAEECLEYAKLWSINSYAASLKPRPVLPWRKDQ